FLGHPIYISYEFTIQRQKKIKGHTDSRSINFHKYQLKTNMDQTALEKLAISNHEEYNRCWNDPNKDWEKYMDTYYTDDTTIYPPRNPPITVKKDIFEFLRKNFPKMKIQMSLREARSLGEESYLGIFNIVLTIDGKEVDRFIIYEVWSKQTGSWKFSSYIWNIINATVDYQ
ncbi:unnamed protein product, partial [Owenia fusiformis]